MSLGSIKERLGEQSVLYIKVLVAVVGIAVLVASTTPAVTAQNRRVEAKRGELARFKDLANKFTEEKRAFDHYEAKLSTSNKAPLSAVKAIERIAASIGLDGRVDSLKAIEAGDNKGYTEDAAHVDIDALTPNELLNLLYRIDEDPGLLLIKNFKTKSNFKDPGLLDLTIEVVRISRRI